VTIGIPTTTKTAVFAALPALSLALAFRFLWSGMEPIGSSNVVAASLTDLFLLHVNSTRSYDRDAAMTQMNRGPTLRDQTDAQLRFALLMGGLSRDERRLICDEMERRRSEKWEAQQEASRKVERRQAVEASFSDMSHAELLAWTQSLIDEENRAMAKELRARIKALENKLAEIQIGELKPVADVEHSRIAAE
jgi:hypothetical protein